MQDNTKWLGTYRLPHGRQFSGLMIVFWLKVCCRWLIRPPEAIVRKYAGPPNVWVEWAEAEGLALGRRMATGVLPSGSSHEDSIKSRKIFVHLVNESYISPSNRKLTLRRSVRNNSRLTGTPLSRISWGNVAFITISILGKVFNRGFGRDWSSSSDSHSCCGNETLVTRHFQRVLYIKF